MPKREREASVKSPSTVERLSRFGRFVRHHRRGGYRNHPWRGHQHGHIPEMLMCMVSSGKTVKLVEIRGGRRVRKRLADLGLNVGMSVRVVQGDSRGPMIIAVKGDARLAIGRGIAHRIIVALQGENGENTEGEIV